MQTSVVREAAVGTAQEVTRYRWGRGSTYLVSSKAESGASGAVTAALAIHPFERPAVPDRPSGLACSVQDSDASLFLFKDTNR